MKRKVGVSWGFFLMAIRTLIKQENSEYMATSFLKQEERASLTKIHISTLMKTKLLQICTCCLFLHVSNFSDLLDIVDIKT